MPTCRPPPPSTPNTVVDRNSVSKVNLQQQRFDPAELEADASFARCRIEAAMQQMLCTCESASGARLDGGR